MKNELFNSKSKVHLMNDYGGVVCSSNCSQCHTPYNPATMHYGISSYYGSWLTVATMRPHGPAITVRCGQETSECDDPGCSVHAGSWRGEHTTIQEPGGTDKALYRMCSSVIQNDDRKSWSFLDTHTKDELIFNQTAACISLYLYFVLVVY